MKKRKIVAGMIVASGILAMTGCKDAEQIQTNIPETPNPTVEVLVTETKIETPAPEVTVEIVTTPEITEVVTETPEAELQRPVLNENIYDTLLGEYYDFICIDEEERMEEDGQKGVSEAMIGLETEEALKNIGYTIRDLSGDGIPELVIGDFSEEDTGHGNMIYALYTYCEEEPVLVFEGWYRNCYRWMGENRFAFQGSGGAMYRIFGIVELSADGKNLIWKDHYFTHETDESFTEIGCYYNTTGEWDVTVSEKLDITLDNFVEVEEELLKDKQWLPMKRMGDLR